MSSGYYDYKDDKLVYAPEVEWAAEIGFVKFANRSIIIEFVQRDDKQRVEIPYRIVDAMTVDSRQSTFTLTLWEGPRLFHINNTLLEDRMAKLLLAQATRVNTPTRVRLVQLANGSVSAPKGLVQLLVYQICVSPADFDTMLRRLHERAIITLHYHSVLVLPVYQRRSLIQSFKDLKATIATYSNFISFDVLYQMEALVRNGFLLPWTVQTLLQRLKARQEEAKRPFASNTARAIKKLFSQIPFPGPDTDASVFDSREIWTYIEENEKGIFNEHIKEEISVSHFAH